MAGPFDEMAEDLQLAGWLTLTHRELIAHQSSIWS